MHQVRQVSGNYLLQPHPVKASSQQDSLAASSIIAAGRTADQEPEQASHDRLLSASRRLGYERPEQLFSKTTRTNDPS